MQNVYSDRFAENSFPDNKRLFETFCKQTVYNDRYIEEKNFLKKNKMNVRLKTVTSLLGVVCISLFLCTTVNAQSSKADEAVKALEAFPAAEAGMVRHVIQMKSQKDESMFKIEIMPGKNMLVDCNHHTLMGKLEEKDLQGWGYTYYVFSSDGQTRSTLMACNKPKENKFVYAQTLTVRYNSRLPIVIYAPEGYEVQYRVWSADKKMKNSVTR